MTTKPQPTTEEPINASDKPLFPETLTMVACDQCDEAQPWPLRCGHTHVGIHSREYSRISPASAAPVVDNLLPRLVNELEQAIAQGYQPNLLDVAEAKSLLTAKPLTAIEAARSAASEILDFLNFDCENDEVKQDIASAAYIVSKYFPFAAATAAPQVSNDLLRDADAIIIVNEGSAGARVEIGFAELQDAQRLHQALAQMRAAAPVDHNSIPLTTYERMLTIEWDKYNARRHELIKAERSRVLSESEVLELFELQWLAGIKRELAKGPHVAAPVEQSDSSIPTCPDCQQGYICEHCGKSIIDYYSGNEGAR